MAGRYGDLDYPTLAKGGFALGIALFAVGVLGEFAIGATGTPVPGWEKALLFDAEVIGVLLFFFSPLVFGVVLPLTE
jgi:hypothetical protein